LRGLWIILLVPFIIPVVLLFGFWHVCRALIFHTLLLALWLPRGRRIFFVYSNSPNWKDYCEREILARLPATALVRNWSERSQWPRRSLATYVFHAYGGHKEFNPLGIVFKPFRPLRLYRFWRPLRDARHGKPQNLERLTSDFLMAARGQG
jgi:hypothetical protein